MNKSISRVNSLAGKGLFPPKYAFTLLIPVRNIFISPNKLIGRMELKDNSIVLEVGPGPGYFSVKVARAIPRGKLYLVEIQQEMLDYARKRLTNKSINNIEYHLCNGSTLPFSDGMFDVIFMVTVFGEIENKQQYIKEFCRILRKDAILSISEQAGDPDKMEPNEIESLLKDSGFKFDRIFGNKRNFTINFKKV